MIKITFITVLILTLISIELKSQVFESAKTGQWTNPTTWIGNTVPPANTNGITIRINSGHNVTFNDNGQNYRYGNQVNLIVEGNLQINGWGGFQLGNDAMIDVKGILTNGQNLTVGQNADFIISGEIKINSVFKSGNISSFNILPDGLLHNTQSFTTGNNSEFVIDGELRNNGYTFVTGANTNLEIGNDGLLRNTTSFVAGKELELIIHGELINSGYKFEAGSGTELFITETGEMNTTTSMNYGSDLMLFIEGYAYIGGYDFIYGENTEIYLLGTMEVANKWVFDGSSSTETYFYVCNGEDVPENVNSNTIVVSEDCGILPVELLFFEVTQARGNVTLTWATASETNSDYFSVERSHDGLSWETIAFVQSAGNSNDVINYSYTDTDVTEAVWYYRLKQTDFDGAIEYFNTKVVEVKTVNEFRVIKTEKAGTRVQIFANFEAGSQVMIFNTMGNLLSSQTFSNDSHVTSFYFPKNAGVVIINYVNGHSGLLNSTKVLIQ